MIFYQHFRPASTGKWSKTKSKFEERPHQFPRLDHWAVLLYEKLWRLITHKSDKDLAPGTPCTVLTRIAERRRFWRELMSGTGEVVFPWCQQASLKIQLVTPPRCTVSPEDIWHDTRRPTGEVGSVSWHDSPASIKLILIVPILQTGGLEYIKMPSCHLSGLCNSGRSWVVWPGVIIMSGTTDYNQHTVQLDFHCKHIHSYHWSWPSS